MSYVYNVNLATLIASYNFLKESGGFQEKWNKLGGSALISKESVKYRMYSYDLMESRLLKRIVVDPKIMAGKPVIRGTRIPVDAIIHRIAQGEQVKEILQDYPKITKQDIKAALEYARSLAIGEDAS